MDSPECNVVRNKCYIVCCGARIKPLTLQNKELANKNYQK